MGPKKAQVYVLCVKGNKGIKLIPRCNQTDISNTISGRNIKSRSTWSFRRNALVKAIF